MPTCPVPVLIQSNPPAVSFRCTMPTFPVPVLTTGFLIFFNLFLPIAWHGHLKARAAPLAPVLGVSCVIARFDHVQQVPANRIGHGPVSAADLKPIRDGITLTIFAIFSAICLTGPLSCKPGRRLRLHCLWHHWHLFHLSQTGLTLRLPVCFSAKYSGVRGSAPRTSPQSQTAKACR